MPTFPGGTPISVYPEPRIGCAASTPTPAPRVRRERIFSSAFFFFTTLPFSSGCKANASSDAARPPSPPFMAAIAIPPPQVVAATDAPSPEKTAGFDGKRAYDLVAKQVNFGPRPSGSPAIVQLQNFLETELKSYGCTVETDSFNADTPAGRLPMKNLLVKIPGEKPGAILLGTHYDTKRLDNFVGADDAGSSPAVIPALPPRLPRPPLFPKTQRPLRRRHRPRCRCRLLAHPPRRHGQNQPPQPGHRRPRLPRIHQATAISLTTLRPCKRRPSLFPTCTTCHLERSKPTVFLPASLPVKRSACAERTPRHPAVLAG